MKLSPEFLLALAQNLGWVLLHSLWQGMAAGAALWWALRLLRRRRAALRHAVCLLALATFAVAVAVTTARQPMPARATPRPTFVLANLSEPLPPPARLTINSSPWVSPGKGEAVSTSWRLRLEALLPWLSAAWLAGLCLGSTRRFLAWRHLREWRRQGVAPRPALAGVFTQLRLRFGGRGGVALLESAEAIAPMLVGVIRPVVLLPARIITGLGEPELEAILAHELAHFVRRDTWTNFAQVACEIVFFYHPVIWWINRQAREEREQAADDLALQHCGDRRLYAGALAHLAELCGDPVLALAATGGSLLARIRRILQPTALEPVPSGWSAALPMALCLLATALLVHGEAPPAKAPAAPPAINLESAAFEKAKPLVAEIFQLDDVGRRQQALERVHQALLSSQPEEVYVGLHAFGQLEEIDFDKAAFRPAVRALLTSPDGFIRQAAAAALILTGAEPQDLERLLAMADDPEPRLRARLSGILRVLYRGDLTGRAGDAVLKLLATQQHSELRQILNGLWGASFSPALEARLLELSQPMEMAQGNAYDALYYALSPQLNKSEACVQRLIALLAHRDVGNIVGRAAWGLQQGVAPAQYQIVATAMTKVLEARVDGALRRSALRCLAQYGSAEQAPALRTLLGKPGLSNDFRQTLEKILAGWEAKPAPAAGNPPPAPLAESTESSPVTLQSKNQLAARQRAAQDRQRYNNEQLNEIETLYQVANTKGKRSPEARASLEQLLTKYDAANRTGCALLYLGQASEGPQRLEYLTRAVEKFSDCYYFNGCQVGGYGRYVLALTLWDQGDKVKARQLFQEIKTTYREATDHRGRPMPELVEAAEKELAEP